MKQYETVTDTGTFGFQLFLHHPSLRSPPEFLHQLGILYTSNASNASNFFHLWPDNVDQDYIVLLSNLIEEGTVQCIVE